MKFINLARYVLRFIFLQTVISFVLIWYFDKFLIINSQQKYLIYLSLVDDWNRFFSFFPLQLVTVDTVLFLIVLVFLVTLYSTKFYTYVNELTYTFRKNYFDEFLNIYLLWCTFMFSFFLLFRIDGIYRSNLIFLTFLIPSVLMIFRNSEVLSILLGRSLFKENFISFNLDKDSSLRNLRILSFRNEMEAINLNYLNDVNIKKSIEETNKTREIHLIVINLESLNHLGSSLEEYLINLNKKILLISKSEIKFDTQFIYRQEEFESFNLVYFNNDIQYGSKFILKRLFDIFISTIIIIFTAPLFLLVFFYIIFVDGWSPVVVQNRVGLHGRIFRMYKFRTMYLNSHELRNELSKQNKKTGPLFKLDNDPRIIKGGNFLRKYSFDELPQLFNVIKGDMSLVGPRPLFDTDRQYFEGGYMRRLNVLPGMTGLLQINDRNTDEFTIWFKYDMEYIENWSLYFDLKILIKTIPNLLNKKIQGK